MSEKQEPQQSELPEKSSPPPLLDLPDIEAITRLKARTIKYLASVGRFPSPIRLSPRRARWVQAEVVNWLNDKIRGTS